MGGGEKISSILLALLSLLITIQMKWEESSRLTFALKFFYLITHIKTIYNRSLLCKYVTSNPIKVIEFYLSFNVCKVVIERCKVLLEFLYTSQS